MQIPKVWIKSWDVSAQLARFGLTADIFETMASAAHFARINCSGNDAPFIPGTYAWGWALRRLRELLVAIGWRSENLGNYSLITNDQYGIHIVVATGDDSTGLDLPANPSTVSPKGIYTQLGTAKNAAAQPSLFGQIDWKKYKKLVQSLKYPVWVVLIHVTDEWVRVEMSLPDLHSSGKKLNDWRERIIIGEFNFVSTTQKATDQTKEQAEEAEEEVVEVNVTRKT